MASLTHKIFASLKAGGHAEPPPPPDRSAAASADAAASTTASSTWNERFYHVAVQGCCHGELDRIYEACSAHERQTGKRIDVLICCGDFQAVRTAADMDSMAVPDKFKVLGDFHKYWSRSPSTSPPPCTAPYLTIFVGGNHENSDLLSQESYGGFVAPNIYYLGHSGVVTVDDCLRVAGLSGIYKEQDYDQPYPPRPYAANYNWKKGAYHVRRVEVAKLHAYLRALESLQRAGGAAQPTSLIDMFVSHDWPVGITAYGDEAQLLRYKPYFRDDIRRHALGNPYTMNLLREAKPLYWVAAHLHCYFEATVSHTFTRATAGSSGSGGDDKKDDAAPAPTSFVALDKCAKGSGFLTFLDLPRRPRSSRSAAEDAQATPTTPRPEEVAGPGSSGAMAGASRIARDAVWLEVLRASHPFVAQNSTAERDGQGGGTAARGDGQRGFDVSAAVREIVARRSSTTTVASSDSDAASLPLAQAAPTTEALLQLLRLPPALPLQQQQQQQGQQGQRHGGAPAAQAHSHRASTQSAAQRPAAAPVADTNARYGMYPQPQRRRVESGSAPWQVADTQPESVSAPPATAPAPLSFFEDVGTAPSPASAPAPLGWFEDTTG